MHTIRYILFLLVVTAINGSENSTEHGAEKPKKDSPYPVRKVIKLGKIASFILQKEQTIPEDVIAQSAEEQNVFFGGSKNITEHNSAETPAQTASSPEQVRKKIMHLRSKTSFDLTKEPAIAKDIAEQKPGISFQDFGEPCNENLSEVIQAFGLCWKIQFQPPHIYADPCMLEKELNGIYLGDDSTENKRYDALSKNKQMLANQTPTLFNALIFLLAKKNLRLEHDETDPEVGLEKVCDLIKRYPTLKPASDLYKLAKKKEKMDLSKVSELIDKYVKPAEWALVNAGMKLIDE